jgi:uncharacterized membrane protein YoaK (UPF0700 family)
MTRPNRLQVIAALLSFNGGFVDAAGFLGLQGLFTSHVTGNFVTLGAALIAGSHGFLGKLLALPEFIAVIMLARFAGGILRAHKMPALRIFLSIEVALLAGFCALAVTLGPFADADSPAALLTGFVGIAAMALQNGLQRVHLGDFPPTTIMTGNTTQAAIDAVDLLTGEHRKTDGKTRTRFIRLSFSIVCFAAGCALSAVLYWLAGFWCLIVAVAVGAVTALLQAESEPAVHEPSGTTTGRTR